VRLFDGNRPWLIPAHVGNNHWALVTIDWRERDLLFYDSLPSRASAKSDEAEVQETVWALLELASKAEGLPAFKREEWWWHSETVR